MPSNPMVKSSKMPSLIFSTVLQTKIQVFLTVWMYDIRFSLIHCHRMIQAKCVVVLHWIYCYGWDIEIKDALKFCCMEITLCDRVHVLHCHSNLAFSLINCKKNL